MTRFFTAFALLLLAAAPAAAQVPLDAHRLPIKDSLQKTGAEGIVPRHVTDILNSRPEAVEALADFHRRKALGLLPARKTNDEIGDVRTFKVYNFEEETLDNTEFEMVRDHERFQVWLSTSEKAGDVLSDATLDQLVNALGNQTPAGSINPQAGIIVNDESIFGDPPNVDGDGKTDVLLVNILDGCFGSCNTPIAGFFTSSDLSTVGNNRDIIYLDSRVARDFFVALALTAAHEYQHLIYANYPKQQINPGAEDGRFVNEGLSEWAELANGYTEGRTITYLGDVDTYNIRFLRFSESVTADVQYDYQRTRLWTSYLADHIGTDVGRITRDALGGYASYEKVLSDLGLNLENLLFDFHTANFINDRSQDPDFGHVADAHLHLRAIPAPANIFDGRLAMEMPLTSLTVNGGAAQYVDWTQVEDLEVQLSIAERASLLKARAFLFQGASVTAQELDLSAGTFSFPGLYDRIALVMAHTAPRQPFVSVDISATWKTDALYQSMEVVYDDGSVPVEQEGNVTRLDAYGLGAGSRQANRFDVPEGSILTRVSVAPYYEHRFQGSDVPTDAPRDFRVHVWADNGGQPGSEILAFDVTDDRINGANGTLVFKNVDLSAYDEQLTNLPSPIYVGITNAGSDLNFLVMGVTEYEGNTTPENSISFLSLPSFNNEWAAFANLTVSNEPVLHNRVIPIRAMFLVPTQPVAVEEESEVPDRVVLHPNYPNPFNPSTTIAFDLPQAAHVRLSVFDLLGREVARLVDAPMAAGAHEVALEASRWASGLYLYRLEAAGQRLTRRMTLLK